jgi:hypothetical protein
VEVIEKKKWEKKNSVEKATSGQIRAMLFVGRNLCWSLG